jgi:DNA-binding CsgD family transcriptional regulator
MLSPRGKHVSDPVPSTGRVIESLLGRDAEVGIIRNLVEASAAGNGEALLLSGEPGAGKSVLLEAAAEIAAAAGSKILRATGVEFEAKVSFSGLDEVLGPLHSELQSLPAPYRDALSAALGLDAGQPSSRLVLFNAVLALFRQAADVAPLLVLIDDLQWLDRASVRVLAFAARRLHGTRVGFLAAVRSGSEGFFASAGLPEHEVGSLSDSAASRLVATRFPALATVVRQRVLAEAAGNPLALVELPAALSSTQRAALAALPLVLPLGRHLEGLFAERVGDLPAQTRELLLLAALQGSGDLRILQAAANSVGGLEHLAAAERAGLVSIAENAPRVTFRHPLIRSAIVEQSAAIERRRAHRALAEALIASSERRAWHLAEAAVGPDGQVAALLEQAARVALKRGDAVGCVVALTRAAELSADLTDRGRRLAEAAFVGADVTGDLGSVANVLADLRRREAFDSSRNLYMAVAAALLLLNGEGDVDTAHRLIAGSIRAHAQRGETGGADYIDALHVLMDISLFGVRDDLWAAFAEVMETVSPDSAPLLQMLAGILADPLRTSQQTLSSLEEHIESLTDETDPNRIVRIGVAALSVDRMAGCRGPLRRVVEDGRRGGAAASAIAAMMHLALDGYMSGDWLQAKALATEGLDTAQRNGYASAEWVFQLVLALLAAGRGDRAQTQILTDEIGHWAAPRGYRTATLFLHQVQALLASGHSEFDEAYQHASAISPAGTLPPHVSQSMWVALDLVESAVATNRHREAAAHAEALRRANADQLSPRLAMVTYAAYALSAHADHTAAWFERALAVPDARRWPFELARVQLLFGQHLRRVRAAAAARTYLTAALETFENLGAQPWMDRAARELRVTGLPNSLPATSGAATLTDRELQIASLAAAGLTNKQIAAQVNLSHRTVGAYLYRIFPKLGISSRAALRDALAARLALPPDPASPQAPTARLVQSDDR